MGRLMVSVASKPSGDAIVYDFPDRIPVEVIIASLFVEIGMASCPHSMKATLPDGRVYCCDCGKVFVRIPK